MDRSMSKVMIAAVAAVVLSACGRGGEAVAPAVAAAPSIGVAAPVAPQTSEPTDVERFLLSQGVKIPTAFDSASGFKAIVADNGAERKLMYVSPDGQSLFIGQVYDLSGNNVTDADMARASIGPATAGVAAVPADQRDMLWRTAGTLDYVEEGTGKKIVYAVVDPMCPYCHQLYRQTREAVAAGQVTVRWLPVAILADRSKGLGAALYGASDRKQGLAQLMAGELEPVRVEMPAAQSMARNLLLLRDSGHTGVPFVIHEDADGVRLEDDPLADANFERIFKG